MSAAVKVPHTIVFKKNLEAQPPVFLAGTFTTPEWLPQEMDPSVDDCGDQTFKATILVEPERRYEFKFRLGNTDNWLVDESKPLAEDEAGRKINFLNVPLEREAHRHSRNLSTGVASLSQAPSAPLDQVAAVAAEVADPAEKLDTDGASPPQASASGGESENEDDLVTPLFAHECFGAYAFADDSMDQEALPSDLRRDSRTKSIDYTIEQPDFNDPTLERFPSERSSVLDTLRRIQSSLGEDQVQLEDVNKRRASADSTDESVCSAGSNGSTTRRRENRTSTGGTRKRSLASLGSIAE